MYYVLLVKERMLQPGFTECHQTGCLCYVIQILNKKVDVV